MELIVTAEDIARRLGYPTPSPARCASGSRPLSRTPRTHSSGTLAKPLLPTEFTETGVRASPDGWVLSHAPIIAVLSATADTSSLPGPYGMPTYTVRYLVGIDARSAPETAPLRLWLRATAAHHPGLADAPARRRRISSATVEGQSVTYDTATEPPLLLTPPDLATTDRWRLRGRRVYQLPVRPTPPGLTNRGLPGGP